MKFVKYLMVLVATMPLLTGCLHSNLDDLPVYSDAKITGLSSEFRYYGTQNWGEYPVVEYKALSLVGAAKIDEKALTIEATFSVPGASGSFTTDIRNTVTLKNIAVMATISAAAMCKPLGNAPPTLGLPGDWSTPPYQYEITAADGTKNVWKVTVKLQ